MEQIQSAEWVSQAQRIGTSDNFCHIQVKKHLWLLRVVKTTPFGIIHIDGSFLQHDVTSLFDASQKKCIAKFP